MSQPNGARRKRAPSEHFVGSAFAFTAGALVLAPILAAANVFHSYTPFALLRLWMCGFSVYGIVLARRAGGARRAWQFFYAMTALCFAFVWGPPVEVWAVIDLVSAALIGLSALFLRTEPASGAA